jgi:hypothetical protein
MSGVFVFLTGVIPAADNTACHKNNFLIAARISWLICKRQSSRPQQIQDNILNGVDAISEHV